MKWILGLSLAVVMLMFNIPAHAESGWNAADHDYHLIGCGHMRQRAGANDAPNCQSYKVGTAYGCCCNTCDNYLAECERSLPQDICERVKTNCQHDCSTFVPSSSASN